MRQQDNNRVISVFSPLPLWQTDKETKTSGYPLYEEARWCDV